jgi:hypothetical protein
MRLAAVKIASSDNQHLKTSPLKECKGVPDHVNQKLETVGFKDNTSSWEEHATELFL